MREMLSGEYTSKVTSAHINSPKYMEWLGVLVGLVCDLGNMTRSIPEAFSIRAASGAQLDIIGASYGVSRALPYTASEGLLSDSDFRSYILAKVLRSRWNGQLGSLIGMWQQIYPDINLRIVDNMNMSIEVECVGNITPAMTEMIQSGLILPTPAGVHVTYTVIAFAIPVKEVRLDMGLFAQGQIGLEGP